MTRRAGRYALDTNILVAVLRGEPEISTRWCEAEAVVLPVPVLGELLYGARRSSRPAENEAAVRSLSGTMQLQVCDEAVSHLYAEIKSFLAGDGFPIPENDVWIAACAMAAQAVLVTRDNHFSRIAALRCEQW